MADFLSRGEFLDVESPVAPIDLNIWTHIAELAFRQSQAQYDMLDKARENLSKTPAVLLGDLDYKKKKTEKLNSQISELTGSGSFMSPKNMGKVRNILSENLYDPELEAIKNRTTRIQEVQARIDKDQLPLANYYDFYESIQNANAEFLKTGQYNSNPTLSYNVSPYTNVSKNMMEVVKEVPELSNAEIAFTADGNYAYIVTVKGKDPAQTMAALSASLGAAEWEQLKADYNYLSKVSPDSLKATEDIKDGNGAVIIKKGDTYTFDQYAQSEVVKIATAVTGQSREISDLQQSVQSKMEMKQRELDAASERERIKKGQTLDMNAAYYQQAIGATTVPVTPVKTGQALAQSINSLSQMEQQLKDEETVLENLRASGADVTTQSGRVAALRTSVEQLRKIVKDSSKVITEAIPDDKVVGITYGNPAFTPGYKKNDYGTGLKALEESLTSMVENGKIDGNVARSLLSKFPIYGTYKNQDGKVASSREYVSWLMSTDLDNFEAELMSSSEYKAWDESSWIRGPIASTLVGDEISNLIVRMKDDKGTIRSNYQSTIQKVEKADRQIANIQMLTAPDNYVDAEGKAVKHDLALLNDDVTNTVKSSPASWIDFRTGRTLDAILNSGEYDVAQTKANVTNGFINGRHAIAVSVYKNNAGGNKADQFVETMIMYNTTDQSSTAERTAAALARGGGKISDEFQADLKYLVPIQQSEGHLNTLPNVSSVDDAVSKRNYAAVTMGATADQQAVEMLIYKVNDNLYFLGSRSGENVNIDKQRTYTSLRDIATALYLQSYSQNVSSEAALKNKLSVNSAISNYFGDLNGPQKNYILQAIGFETGGTYSPAKLNESNQKAVGLIQFYPTRTDNAGDYVYEFNIPTRDGKTEKRSYTQKQLQSMDINTQVFLTKAFYKDNGIDPSTFDSGAEAWLAVFLPEVYKLYAKNKAVYKTKKFNDLVVSVGGQTLLKSLSKHNADFISTAISKEETLGEFFVAAQHELNKH